MRVQLFLVCKSLGTELLPDCSSRVLLEHLLLLVQIWTKTAVNLQPLCICGALTRFILLLIRPQQAPLWGVDQWILQALQSNPQAGSVQSQINAIFGRGTFDGAAIPPAKYRAEFWFARRLFPMQDLKNWSPLLLFGEINRQKFSLFLPLFSMRTLEWLFCCAIGVTNTTALPSSFGNLLKWQLSWTCSYVVPSYLVPLKNTCPDINNKITEITEVTLA